MRNVYVLRHGTLVMVYGSQTRAIAEAVKMAEQHGYVIHENAHWSGDMKPGVGGMLRDHNGQDTGFSVIRCLVL